MLIYYYSNPEFIREINLKNNRERIVAKNKLSMQLIKSQILTLKYFLIYLLS